MRGRGWGIEESECRYTPIYIFVSSSDRTFRSDVGEQKLEAGCDGRPQPMEKGGYTSEGAYYERGDENRALRDASKLHQSSTGNQNFKILSR